MSLRLDAQPERFTLNVTFQHPSGSESSARFICVELDQGALDECNAARRPDEATMLHALKGWSGVLDGEGQEAEFSAERAEALLSRPWIRYQLARAYLRKIGGLDRGN